MTSWPGAPLAAAVELLALEGRGASGVFRLGARTLVVRRGRIAAVSLRPGVDASLHDFLVAAGRLAEAGRARLAGAGLGGDALETAVMGGVTTAAERSELRMETLREALRSAWMERLARTFAEEGGELSLARESSPPSIPEDGYDVSGLALVLDALERCATGGDAEAVGQRAQEWVRFAAGPTVSRAKRWAQIEAPREVRVASLLSGSPAAAPRIAALGRAGFLEILPGTNQGPPAPAPAPIRRSSSRPPPARRPTHPGIPPVSEPTISLAQEGMRMSLEPPRAPRVQLAPGAARVALSLDLSATFPTLTLGDVPLADPLDGPEDQVAALEDSGASPAARARAWKIVAEVARERLGALDEHARAAREAAAADPEDVDHLRRAAEACTAIEETELALAYGKAVVGIAKTAEARARAMFDYALLCRRLGKKEDALQAASAATQVAPDDASAFVLTAEIELSLGRRQEAAETFVEAASLLRDDDPARAHVMSARAYRASPSSARAVEQLSTSLARAGLHDAAIELRAELARLATDPDDRRRLLLVAAERAELHGTTLHSASLLLEAFDTDPTIDVVWAPLESDLAEAGARRERAIVLEEIALAATDDAGEWWAKAADARALLEPDSSLEIELRTRSLVELPAHAPTLETIRDLAERAGQPDAFLGALDRAIRGPRSAGAARKKLAGMLAQRAEARHPTLAAWAREIERTGALPAIEASLEADLEPLGRDTVDAAALDPSRRAKVIARALAQLERSFDPELARALLRAARNEGDDRARAVVLGLLAGSSPGTIERTRLRALEAAYAVFARDGARASAACRDAIAQGHSDAEIGTRLRRMRTGVAELDAMSQAAAWAAEAAHGKTALRARALAELACIDEARGQTGRALQLAADALREDPSCARAALIFHRRDRGADWSRTEGAKLDRRVAAALRTLLGDTPETLRAAALTAEDPAEALATTVRWAALDPISAEPIFTSLALSDAHGLPEYDDAAIDALVTAPRCAPVVIDPLLRAIDRITQRDPKRALERALRGAAALGPWGHALRARAFEIGLAHHDHDGLVRAAESQLASPPGDRATHLRRIAQLRREGGDRAGEARTWVRLLATIPRDDAAIHRLAELYAQTGERDRLIAALSLRVEEGASAHERAIGHLELAAAHGRALGEPEQAEEHLRAAEAELDSLAGEPDEEGALTRLVHLGHALVAMGRIERGMELLVGAARKAEPALAVGHYEAAIAAALRDAEHSPRALAVAEEALERCGTRGRLLLAFEQLALDLGNVAAAERTYTHLITRAVGVHGRRALAYRRARWLDRAGAGRQALDAYVEACGHQASSGALLSSLEKLARAQGELDSLARGLRALAENAPHPTVRLSLLRRAASVLSEELGRPREALDLLAAEWTRTFATELESDLAREVARTSKADRDGATAKLRELVAEIERRAAEAWMGEERAHLLRKAARLYATGLADLETAEAYVWRAVAALRDENAEEETLRAPVEELATMFRACGKEADLAGWIARATRQEGTETAPGSASAAAETALPDDLTSSTTVSGVVSPSGESLAESASTSVGTAAALDAAPAVDAFARSGTDSASVTTVQAASGTATDSGNEAASDTASTTPTHADSAATGSAATGSAATENATTENATTESVSTTATDTAAATEGVATHGASATEPEAAGRSSATILDAPAAAPERPPPPPPPPATAATQRGWASAPAPERPSLVTAERPSPSPSDLARSSFVSDPRRIDDLIHTAEHAPPNARRIARRILAACEPDPVEEALPVDATVGRETQGDVLRQRGIHDASGVRGRSGANALRL